MHTLYYFYIRIRTFNDNITASGEINAINYMQAVEGIYNCYSNYGFIESIYLQQLPMPAEQGEYYARY